MNTVTVHYIDKPYALLANYRPVKYPYGQDQMGYGRKIATSYVVIFLDNPKRWYRVYATCFSNAASHWITKNSVKLHLCNQHEVAEWNGAKCASS